MMLTRPYKYWWRCQWGWMWRLELDWVWLWPVRKGKLQFGIWQDWAHLPCAPVMNIYKEREKSLNSFCGLTILYILEHFASSFPKRTLANGKSLIWHQITSKKWLKNCNKSLTRWTDLSQSHSHGFAKLGKTFPYTDCTRAITGVHGFSAVSLGARDMWQAKFQGIAVFLHFSPLIYLKGSSSLNEAFLLGIALVRLHQINFHRSCVQLLVNSWLLWTAAFTFLPNPVLTSWTLFPLPLDN